MEYKVCILAAGKNDRLSYAENFPVALLPIGTSASISKIIEKFPLDKEIVIVAGYKKDLLKDFLEIAHPERKIFIVEILDYTSIGSGPGRSLLACKKYLQCPFIFTSADTIVTEPIPEPQKNWIGVSSVTDTTNYCMAEVENDYVVKLHDKVPMPTLLKTCKNYKTILNNAFIGMAGIYNYEDFWESLEENQDLIDKKLQVSNGLSGLIERKLETVHFFTWFSIGTEAGYNLANRFYEENKVILKPDEFIYFENGKVIKYFKDPEVVRQRVERSKKLKGIVPELVDITPNFYSYYFVKGNTLAKINDVSLFRELLNCCNETMWKPINLRSEESAEFKKSCDKFYKDKTKERVEMFYKTRGHRDREEIVNGEKTPLLREMLSQINWEKISDGVPVNFHGDFQPENIIICEKGFQLIDWRHNFAGSVERGDIYYDFAKLHHALIITHQVIRDNQFEIKINQDVVNYDFFIKSNLTEYKDLFEKFIIENGYDLDRLKILSALTFLNIAPLHHYPYDMFLYYLGKYTLYKELKHNNPYKLKREGLKNETRWLEN